MLNTDNFTAKLQHILAYYNFTSSAFADTIEVQRSSISHILSGRNKASIEFILKIANTFPEINVEWLLGRKTDFIKGDTGNKTKLQNADVTSVNNNKNVEFNSEFRDEITNVNLSNDVSIEKIVVFYTDKTFITYDPG